MKAGRGIVLAMTVTSLMSIAAPARAVTEADCTQPFLDGGYAGSVLTNDDGSKTCRFSTIPSTCAAVEGDFFPNNLFGIPLGGGTCEDPIE